MTSIVLNHAAVAYQNADGPSFSEAAILSPDEAGFYNVQNDLLDNDIDIRPMVLTYFPHRDDKIAADLLCDIFVYIRSVNRSVWNGDEMVRVIGDDQDEVNDFNNLLSAYGHATKIFQQRKSGWFVPVLHKLTTQLVALAARADNASRSKRGKYIETVTRVIIPPFGLAASDRGTDIPDKRDATFFLANLLFKLYYDLDNIRLCDTILKNLEKQLPRLHEFPRADQTMFHFWRGRIYLTQLRIRQAHDELALAFDMCTNANYKTKRIIFIYLLSTSIPLGRLPHPSLLAYFSLSTQFSPLIHATRLGDIATYRSALSGNWRSWFARRGVWMMLKEKGEVVVWRSLVRRVVLLARERMPTMFSTSVKAPPTITFTDILTAFHASSKDSTYTMNDVESMCCSLLDQGYIKGYILHSRYTLVLQKSDALGFPLPSSVSIDSGMVDGEDE